MSSLCLLDLTAAFDIPWTTSCCNTGLSVSLVSVAQCQNVRMVPVVSVRQNVLVCCIVFSGCTSSVIHIICSVPQYWVRCCSSCTQRTMQLFRRSMMYFYTRSLTTPSCIYTVVTPIRRQLLLGWNDASQTSATGCPPTALRSTRTRLSCCGSD